MSRDIQHLLCRGLLVALAGLSGATLAEAQYDSRFSVTTAGAITFTGNTLGLNKAASSNAPGTNGAIGTFISTNLALRDTSPAPGWPVPTYNGTTASWQQNSSAAQLVIPAGSTVLHAELVWGGSYSYGGENVSAFLNNAVSLTTPAGTSSVSPNAATSRQLGTAGAGGTCSSAPCYYVRTQDVTALVRAGGAGTYTVGGVPATQATSENNANNAGWTLAVVYQNFSLPTRNMSIFTGLQQGGSAPASVSGFCTPPSGTLSGRLAVSALEGDPSITGDEMRFGPTSTLGNGNRVSGPNNPLTNFFASQLNSDSGALDTTGSFGTLNSTPGTGVSGARQGWDITNVDVSNRLAPNQTSAFAQGTTTGDQYAITTLGMQIDVAAPGFPVNVKFVDRPTTRVGEILTYTITLNNTGNGTANVVRFSDTPPLGTTFVAGSVTVDGVSQPAFNPIAGFNVRDLAAGDSVVVTFRAQVTAVPAAPAVAQYSNTANWTYSYVSCAGQPVQNGTFQTNPVVTTVPRVVPIKAASPSPAVPGTALTYTVSMPNTGTANATGVSLTDPIPAGATYVLGTTTLNGVAVPDGPGGAMPFATTALVNSPGEPAGQVNVAETAVVTFQVIVSPAATGTLTNTATVDPDGPGGQGTLPASVATPLTPRADVIATKSSSPSPYVPGAPMTYVVTVSNVGPSHAPGTLVQDTLPAALSAFTWTCVGTGGATCPASGSGNISATVNLPAGGITTFTLTGTVPPGTTGVLSNQVTATTAAGVTDPAPGNNTGNDTNPVGPVADLAVSKVSAPNPYVPGAVLTYTITVNNLGPSNVTGARLVDVLPGPVAGFGWTCAGVAGGSCATTAGVGSLDVLLNLPSGGGAVFVVSGPIAPGTTALLDNIATIAPPIGVTDPTPGNNSSSDQNPTRAIADLSVSKTSAPSPYVPGNALTYTIVVTNAGPSTATNARVVDALPPALSAFTWICAGAAGGVCTVASGTGSIDTLVTLPPAATATFTVTGTVPAGTTGVLTNSATVTAPPGVTDPTAGNNGATDNNTPSITADLAVTKSVAPSPYVPGLPLTYTVVVSNAGPSNATNVRVQDTFPAPLAGFTWACTGAAGGVCGSASGSGGIDAVVTVPVGGTVTYTVSGIVPSGTTVALANTASVTPAAGTADPNGANNSATAVAGTSPVADLSVSKSSTPNPYVPGSLLTYTVTVLNNGPSDALGATVTDTLPAALSAFTWTCTSAGGTCGATSGAGNIATTVNLPAGTSATFILSGTVPPGTVGQLLNTASVTPPGGVTDPTPGNNTITDPNPAGPQADLTISKSSAPSPYVPGAALTYAITVNNLGPSNVVNARVQDALPAPLAAFTWTCGSSGGTCGSASGTGSIDALVTLPVGTSASFTVTGTVPPGTTASLANTASVTPPAGTGDPVPGNNTATDSSLPGPRADLTVSKSSSPNPYVPGAPLTYTVVVSNLGPSDVTGARVQDVLPAALSAFTWTCAGTGGGVCGTASGTGSVDALVTLPSATSVTFTMSGIVPPATTGSLDNVVTVAPPVGVIDPVPGNNRATDQNPVGPQADLTISKASTPNPYVPGAPLTYTIVVSNVGPSNVVGARVQDVLPTPLSGFTWTCAVGAGATCGTASGTGSLDALVSLAVGTSATFTVTGTVPSGTTGPLLNTATIAPPPGTTDPAPGNNTATDANPANAQADLVASKTSTPNPYVPGLPLTYTITVNNLGPSDVVGARVQDALPAPLSAFTWTCLGVAGGTCGTASGTGDIDALVALPAGAGAVFTVTGVVPPGTTGGLVNSATIAPPPGTADPTPGNNTATDSNPAGPQADLGITKSSTPNPYVPGAPLTYTIVVSNAGPSAVTAVRVQDALPAPLAAFTWTCVGASGGACGTASGVGSIDALVALPANATATFSVTGTVPAGTSGQLLNTATVTPPPGTIDPSLGNNAASDPNPVGPQADLSVTKSSAPAPYVPGLPLTYTITVANAGPSNVLNARVQDAFPLSLAGFTWTCASTAGAACGATSGVGTIDALVDLAAGASVTFLATGPVPSSTTGTLVNTATVTAPLGTTDPTPGNNSATNTSGSAPQADLTVSKTSTPKPYVPGLPLTYTITVNNLGPSDVVGAPVTDTVPLALAAFTWTCTAPTGGVCGAASGTGNIATAVSLPAGTTATFVLTGTVPAGTTGQLSNSVSVAPPAGTTDPVPGNNTSVDDSLAGPQADLVISKASAPNPFVPGGPLTYTITVTNLGPSAVTGARVQDALPTALSTFGWTCAAALGGSCGTASGAGSIDALVSLGVGVSATFTIVGTVPSNVTGALVNTATVAPPAGTTDPVPGNNTAADANNASASADLAISKSSAPDPYVPGQALTYTITVTNLGPSDVTNARVQDALPAPLSSFTWTCLPGPGTACGTAAGAGSIDGLVDVPAGGSVAFLVTGTVPSGTTGPLVNTATVATPAGVSDPTPGNNQATDVNPSNALADVAITKSSTPDPYVPGLPLTYTIIVSNLGPSDAPLTRVQDALPAPLAAFTWSCTGAGGSSCATASGAGSIDALVSLLAGGSVTFTLTGTVPPGTSGPLVNTATVTPPTGVIDLAPGNNQATDTNPSSAQADLSITKSSTPDPYVPGLPLTYTIVVANAGPSTAPNARVVDVVPAPVGAFSWVCAAAGGATCATSSGVGDIDALVTLPPGAIATFTLSGTVPAGTTGPLVNTASVIAPAGVADPVAGNNQATDTNPTNAQADLSISKTSTPDPYVPGLPLTYTITVANAGPSNATNARVQDTLPAALSSFTWTCTPGSGAACGTSTGVGDIDALVSLPAGTTVTFSVTGAVPGALTGALVNTATVTPPSGVADPVPGNNQATNTNPTGAVADLTISKSSAPDPYVPGLPLTYTIVVHNLGPSTATNARVQDVVPGLTGVTWTCTGTAGGACAIGSGSGDIDALASLPAGGSVVFRATGLVPAGLTGPLVNTATITPPIGVADPVPGNNQATDVNPTGAQADLSVTKTSTPNPYVPGSPLTYGITVSNAGPSNVVGARVRDVLPAPLLAFTWSCTGVGGATCATASGVGSLDALVSLPVGSTVAFTVTGTVPPGTTGPLANTATVTPPAGVVDPTPGNNQAANANPVGPVADLAITKTSSPNPYTAGSPLTYTIVVSNAGPSTAANARVQDVLPAPLASFTWICAASGGVCHTSGGVGDIDALVTLPPAATATFTVTGVVPLGTSGALRNTASVSPPPGVTDPTPNNAATDLNQPLPVPGGLSADVCLLQTYPAQATAGGLLTFTYTATNRGPGAALDLFIDGMIPTGTTFVSAAPSAGGVVSIVNGMIVTTWPGLTLPGPGHDRSVTITLRVDPAAASGFAVWNWFMADSRTSDPYHFNNMVDSYVVVNGSGPSADLALTGVAMAAGMTGPQVASRVGQDVVVRFTSTNTGVVPARAQYALLVDDITLVDLVSATVTHGTLAASGPSSGVWDTGDLAPGILATAELRLRMRAATAVKIMAVRANGTPADPNAANDIAEVDIDGVGAAPASGREVAIGNVDSTAAGGEFVVAAGQGETPQVRVYRASGALAVPPFYAFDRTFLGGVALASCDVDADGVDEIVAGQRSGGSQVRVLRLVAGLVTQVTAFQPFEPAFSGGVSVACADVDGDGRGEVVVGSGAGRAPEVRAFAVNGGAATQTVGFAAYESSFTGGVRVSAARYPGGVVAPFQIVTTPGPGRAVALRAWTVAGGSASVVAAAPVVSGAGGAYTALGDANNDGALDLAVMPDNGVPLLLGLWSLGSGTSLAGLPTGALGFTGGMRVAIGPSGGPLNDIAVVDGPGGSPRLQAYQWLPGGAVVPRVSVLAIEVP